MMKRKTKSSFRVQVQTHFHIQLDKFIHSNVMSLFMLPFDWARIALKYSMVLANIRMHSGILRWLYVFPLRNCHKLCLFEFIHNNKCYHKICDPTIKSVKKNACVLYHRQSKKKHIDKNREQAKEKSLIGRREYKIHIHNSILFQTKSKKKRYVCV